MKCGLLGRTLGHSYSPQIHSLLADYSYQLYQKEPDELEDFLLNGDFTGLNVTIPYKKSVIPYCRELTERAKAVGAVNTIVKRKDGSLIGHNTDYFGFSVLLKSSGLMVAGKKVLVLGSGGASNTASAVLKAEGAQVVIISRSGPDNYQNLQKHGDARAIVNATPVGMYPNVGVSPVDLDLFPELEGVLDLIYNPARTELLLEAEKRGLIFRNGLLMLVAQAKESAEWFCGHSIPDSKITEIYHILRRQMENIVLIGMPGCGKSTVGALLAEKTGKRFIDADVYLEEKYGRKIPDIFAEDGESTFRAMETEVLSECAKKSGIILATGGGCVTRKENYHLLHQNGSIFYLERQLTRLPTDGRPLSQQGSVEEMYEKRLPLYQRFSDFTVDNNCMARDTAEHILRRWEEKQ